MRDKSEVTPERPWVTINDKAYFYSTEDGEDGTEWDGESYYCKGDYCYAPVRLGDNCWNCGMKYKLGDPNSWFWIIWYSAVIGIFFFL